MAMFEIVSIVISEAVNLSVSMVFIFYFCKSDESLPDCGVQIVTFIFYQASIHLVPVKSGTRTHTVVQK